MPNHVYNNLTVTGPESDVRAFHNAVNVDSDDNSGIIRAFLPFPAKLEGEEITDKNGDVVGRAFSDEGYYWCLKNWGTKWGDYETEIVYEPAEIIPGNWGVAYRYNTAWSPANAAIITIAKQFPNLTFDVSWEEEGFQSCGALAVKGEHAVDDYVSYDGLPDYPEDWNDDDSVEKFRDEFTRTKDLSNERVFERLTELIERC